MLQRIFGRIRQNWLHKLRLIMDPAGDEGVKRPPSPEETSEAKESAKKQKTEANLDRKRKCVILFGYNGKGYYGLQRNIGLSTIEEDLCKALLDAKLIPLEHFEYMSKMTFQRAARTDKGVSAVGNCVSLKMLVNRDNLVEINDVCLFILYMLVNRDNLVEEINSHLPSQIRVFDCFRTTQGFNSKNHCDARTYSYVLPTYAFLHKDLPLTVDYRMDADTLEKANVTLNLFRGTHNFHNYTSGIKPHEKCATRYIIDFECKHPFVRHGVEFCEISVKGQSFMMHQIRKMVGTVLAVLKGYIDQDFIIETFKHNKVFLPKAPGLGLMLEKLHYPVYNKRHGSDHTPINFEKLKDKSNPFKEEFILSDIYKTEIEEYSMLKWLPELDGLSFGLDETEQSGEHMTRRQERQINTYKFIYGPDWVPPPEPMKFKDSDFKMDSSTNQGASSKDLTNQKTANQDGSGDSANEKPPSSEIPTNEKEVNEKVSNELEVENIDKDLDKSIDVNESTKQSVLEEGAR